MTTKFSDAELDGAQFLGLIASGQFGYPEPSEDWGYLDATFDASEHCRICGVGAKQIAPFRLKEPPTARKNSVIQLNWIFDEYFVASGVWASVFKPSGVRSRPVVLHQTGRVIESTVQIRIDAICEVESDRLPMQECGACGRIKYEYSLRGPYPAPVSPTAEIFKSSQWFGAGGRAFRLVMVSRDVFRRVREAGLRGITFCPCARESSLES